MSRQSIPPLVFVYLLLFFSSFLNDKSGEVGVEMTHSIREIYGCCLTQKCEESYSSFALNTPLTGLTSFCFIKYVFVITRDVKQP